jgi:hypothetical protein
MLNDREMAEFLRDISPNQLLIVNKNDRIEVLFCPFEVISKDDISFIKKHQSVFVELIKVTRDLKTVFIIRGKAFYAIHFYIR